MTPDLGVGDVLGGVRRELERSALRARNGIKYVAGGEWAPVAPTPSDVVWQEGKVHVRRYRREGPPTLGPPVLAFLGLVGRAYVFDLWKDNSIARLLIERGFDVYVLDWGEPDEREADNTLEDYLEGFLPRGIRAVQRTAEADEVSVLAYCMGGAMALHGLAGQPDLPVRNLVTMATPVDYRHLGPFIDALREGRMDPDSLIDETGNVPGEVIGMSFKSRKPTGDLVQYANLWQHLWDDEYMEGFQAIGRWLDDHVPMPGALFRQTAEQWLREDGFTNDTLRLGGRRVSLGDIRTRTLGVYGKRDDIVPEASTAPLTDVLSGAPVELLCLDAGHASLTSGRKALTETLPGIFDWLTEHSDEV